MPTYLPTTVAQYHRGSDAAPLPPRLAPARRTHLAGIDLIRLLAAFALVIYHVTVVGVADRYFQPIAILAGPAALGPSLTSFFILLSGFVLYHASVGPDGALGRSSRAFWRLRAANLVPLMLLAHLLMAPLLLTGESGYGVGEAIARGVLVLGALQAWVPSLALSYSVPLWTLSVLAACFAVFPATVRRVRHVSAGQAVLALVALWAAMVGLTSAAYAAQARGMLPIDHAALERGLQTLPPLRFAEFLTGVLLARLWKLRGEHPGTIPAVVLVPGLVLAALLPFPWLWQLPTRVVANGGLAPLWCLVVWAAAWAPPLRSEGAARLMKRLGRAAFPIYALHFPLLAWLDALMFRGWLGDANGVAVVAYLVMMIPIGIAADSLLVSPVARRLAERRRAPRLVDPSAARAA